MDRPMKTSSGDMLPGPAGWRNGSTDTAAQVLKTDSFGQGSSARCAASRADTTLPGPNPRPAAISISAR